MGNEWRCYPDANVVTPNGKRKSHNEPIGTYKIQIRERACVGRTRGGSRGGIPHNVHDPACSGRQQKNKRGGLFSKSYRQGKVKRRGEGCMPAFVSAVGVQAVGVKNAHDRVGILVVGPAEEDLEDKKRMVRGLRKQRAK